MNEISRPTAARVYDYLLGGKDNYQVDRDFVKTVLADANPHVAQLARDNREFLRRAVRFLVAERGIRQFLDIGTGLPTAENVHEVAQRIAPASRVVYVDNDPVVLTHARALLASSAEGSTAYIDADARDVDTILQGAAAGLDFREPVALLFVALLHFLPDDDAAPTVSAFQDALAPGSHLVISHATLGLEEVASAYQQAMGTGTLRTAEQITALFGGWELADPGVVPVLDWRRARGPVDRSAAGLFLGGVARKPHPGSRSGSGARSGAGPGAAGGR